MNRHIFIGIMFLVYLFGVASIPQTALSSSPKQPESSEYIAKLLRDNPQIILSVLEKHSEELLAIVQDGANKRRDKELHQTWQKELYNTKKINLKNHIIRGKNNAPVTIVAYSDFTCSFCARANEEVMNLLSKYPNEIRYIFKTFSHGDESIETLSASYFVAAAMQDKNKAWALHDLMFAERDELVTRTKSALIEMAQKVGLDIHALEADSKKNSVAAILDDDLAEATRLSVDGTPTIFVNNLTLRGTPSAKQLEDAFKMARDAAVSK